MNMVGTPCSAVQRSACTVCSTASGSKPSPGRPWWRRGSGSPGCPSPCRSSGTAARGCTAGRAPSGFIASPTKKPLLRMLWWVSVAPLGWPVVPLVNWMLIGSSNCRVGERSRRVGRAWRRCRPWRHRRSGACRRWRAIAHAITTADAAAHLRRAPRARRIEFGRELAHHADVIAALELSGDDDQRLARHLVQRVVEFGEAIGRIDVDQTSPALAVANWVSTHSALFGDQMPMRSPVPLRQNCRFIFPTAVHSAKTDNPSVPNSLPP
jgi:hypothetical protein